VEKDPCNVLSLKGDKRKFQTDNTRTERTAAIGTFRNQTRPIYSP